MSDLYNFGLPRKEGYKTQQPLVEAQRVYKTQKPSTAAKGSLPLTKWTRRPYLARSAKSAVTSYSMAFPTLSDSEPNSPRSPEPDRLSLQSEALSIYPTASSSNVRKLPTPPSTPADPTPKKSMSRIAQPVHQTKPAPSISSTVVAQQNLSAITATPGMRKSIDAKAFGHSSKREPVHPPWNQRSSATPLAITQPVKASSAQGNGVESSQQFQAPDLVRSTRFYRLVTGKLLLY